MLVVRTLDKITRQKHSQRLIKLIHARTLTHVYNPNTLIYKYRCALRTFEIYGAGQFECRGIDSSRND